MTEIVTISGSPSPNSRSAAVLEYASEVFRCHRLNVSNIDVRNFNADDLLFARFDSAAVKRAQEQVEQAQAVIIATPVYKAAYTGVLKAFLDLLPQNALRNKVVLPIATGGTVAHLLSIDYALKPVLNALGAQHILQGIYIVDSQVKYVPGENLWIEPEVEQRLLRLLEDLADSLAPSVIASSLREGIRTT